MIAGHEVVYLRGVVAAELGRIESRDGSHRRALLLQSRPETIAGHADRCDRSDPGYHYSASIHLNLGLLLFLRPGLCNRAKAGQRARGNSVHEHRTDYMGRRPWTHYRNFRTIPYVQDSYVRPVGYGRKAPLDFHPFRDTTHVPETDAGSDGIDGHLRQPPGRPIESQARLRGRKCTEGPVSRHLHQSAPIGAMLAEAHIPVMRKMIRPTFHPLRQLEDF